MSHLPGLRAFIAVCAGALALLVGGCSTPRTAPESEPEEVVEEVALDPGIGKIDEAGVAAAGPEQIEQAIEALDAQTESQPRLVGELGTLAGAEGVHPGDLF